MQKHRLMSIHSLKSAFDIHVLGCQSLYFADEMLDAHLTQSELACGYGREDAVRRAIAQFKDLKHVSFERDHENKGNKTLYRRLKTA